MFVLFLIHVFFFFFVARPLFANHVFSLVIKIIKQNIGKIISKIKFKTKANMNEY